MSKNKKNNRVKRVLPAKKNAASEVASAIGNGVLADALNDPAPKTDEKVKVNKGRSIADIVSKQKAAKPIPLIYTKVDSTSDVERNLKEILDRYTKPKPVDPVTLLENQVLTLTKEYWTAKKRLIKAKQELDALYVKIEKGEIPLCEPTTDSKKDYISEMKKKFEKELEGKIL